MFLAAAHRYLFLCLHYSVLNVSKRLRAGFNPGCRGDRSWLSHGLVVTLPISYSLDGGTLWGFTRDMRIAD